MRIPGGWTFRVVAAALIAASVWSGAVARAEARWQPPLAAAIASVAKLAACPVGGLAEYVDSWGDSRSGGRRHEGVDMAATRGTPVLAVRSGTAEFKRSNLGGNAIWLVTPSGERYYYAHLDSWEGASRTVTAGEVVGYVGSTGNARGDHLHFETRVGEDAANPYPLVQSACAPVELGTIPRVGPRLNVW